MGHSDALSQQIKEVIAKIRKQVNITSTFDDDIDDLKTLLNSLKENTTPGFNSQDFMDYYDNFTCKVKDLDNKFPGIHLSHIMKSSSRDINDETLVFIPDQKFFNALPKIINATKKR